LYLEQRSQLFRLAVGEQARVVEDAAAALEGPDPAAGVAADLARMGLDLDQIQALRGQHQGVHLVDGAVLGDELEVRLDPIGLMVRELATEKVQPLLLPGVIGRGDLLPKCLHGLARRMGAALKASKRRLIWP